MATTYIDMFPIIIAHIDKPFFNPLFERTEIIVEAKINPIKYPPVTPKKYSIPPLFP